MRSTSNRAEGGEHAGLNVLCMAVEHGAEDSEGKPEDVPGSSAAKGVLARASIGNRQVFGAKREPGKALEGKIDSGWAQVGGR